MMLGFLVSHQNKRIDSAAQYSNVVNKELSDTTRLLKYSTRAAYNRAVTADWFNQVFAYILVYIHKIIAVHKKEYFNVAVKK